MRSSVRRSTPIAWQPLPVQVRVLKWQNTPSVVTATWDPRPESPTVLQNDGDVIRSLNANVVVVYTLTELHVEHWKPETLKSNWA